MADSPINRRRFFSRGFRELLKPLAESLEPLEVAAQELAKLDAPKPAPQVHPKPVPGAAARRFKLDVYLRPPGALEEPLFRDRCSKCGTCADVCPARCIHIDPTGQVGHGVPYIDVDTMPCVLCEGLNCMNHCPSGALVPTPLTDIDMGTAVWHEETCVRSAKGEDCTICVDQCPLGAAAIQATPRGIAVNPLSCVGCGVCEYYCPTKPKSLSIIPKAAKAGRPA